jgi:hypothetical protein
MSISSFHFAEHVYCTLVLPRRSTKYGSFRTSAHFPWLNECFLVSRSYPKHFEVSKATNLGNCASIESAWHISMESLPTGGSYGIYIMDTDGIA